MDYTKRSTQNVVHYLSLKYDPSDMKLSG